MQAFLIRFSGIYVEHEIFSLKFQHCFDKAAEKLHNAKD